MRKKNEKPNSTATNELGFSLIIHSSLAVGRFYATTKIQKNTVLAYILFIKASTVIFCVLVKLRFTWVKIIQTGVQHTY